MGRVITRVVAFNGLALGLLGLNSACGGDSTNTGTGGGGATTDGGAAGRSGGTTGGSGRGGFAGSADGGSAQSGGSGGKQDGGAAGKGGSSGGMSGGAGAGGSTGGAGAGGSSGGNGECTPSCDVGRECCDGTCVNLQNDLRNCGECGTLCEPGQYCTGGDCIAPACDATCAGNTQCCGSECCSDGQLCCDPQGPIDTSPRCLEPNDQGTCPVGCAPLCECASPETAIATPHGERAIASLVPGDEVYSVNDGAIAVVPILQVHRKAVTRHHVRRIRLANGEVLEISAGHPTADGRTFADLRPGVELDGVAIVGAETIRYGHSFTYDILPASDTGTYFAEGVLIGSTLFEAPHALSRERCTPR